MDDEDADRIRRLVAARIPELSETQIAEALAAGMSAEVGELVLAVADAMAERLDALEESLTGTAARGEVSDYVEAEAHHHRRVAA